MYTIGISVAYITNHIKLNNTTNKSNNTKCSKVQ